MNVHWSNINEAGALIGMRFMMWVDSILGRWAFDFVLIFLMAYFFLRRGDARRASVQYLGRVRLRYPESLGRAPLCWYSYRQFYAFGLSLRDKYRAWAESHGEIEMEPGQERLLVDALSRKSGSLLIGSHFGNLEYSRGVAHRHPGLTLNVLIYDQHAIKFAALIEKVRPDSRMNLIQVTDVDIALALKLKDKVDRGEWVVIAGDRVPVGESSRSCEAAFFGSPARFPIGPYALAAFLQCPVYLLHCFRRAGRYHLGLEHFEDVIRSTRANRQADYARYAGKFAAALEAQVERAPLQWFNFYDFWSSPGNAETRRQLVKQQ